MKPHLFIRNGKCWVVPAEKMPTVVDWANRRHCIHTWTQEDGAKSLPPCEACVKAMNDYESELESAKREAIEVVNGEDHIRDVRDEGDAMGQPFYLQDTGELYPLPEGYKVEIKRETELQNSNWPGIPKDVARIVPVTPEPAVESEDELWDEVYHDICKSSNHGITHSLIGYLKSKYTITRKK